MRGKFLLILIILFGGWGLLEVLLWKSELGGYAYPPQELVVKKDVVALVAGGRAGVVFNGSPHRRDGYFLVRCKEAEEKIRLGRDETSAEICGIQLRLIDLPSSDQASLEITWDDDS